VITFIDMSSDDLPLFLICCTEHFHADRNMSEFENRPNSLVALQLQVFVRRTDEDLVLLNHKSPYVAVRRHVSRSEEARGRLYECCVGHLCDWRDSSRWSVHPWRGRCGRTALHDPDRRRSRGRRSRGGGRCHGATEATGPWRYWAGTEGR